MGVKNYLIDGMSGTGKTTVAEELERRGYHVVHGDRVLAYQGDPETGKKLNNPAHKNEQEKIKWEQKNWIWDLEKIKSITTNHSVPITFFCGGSRNSSNFIKMLDDVFILEVNDINVIYRRLDERVAYDPTDFGGKPEEQEMVSQLYKNKEGIPKAGIKIDATMPLDQVVDAILVQCA